MAHDAIDLLTQRDPNGRWAREFTLRGRSYVMDVGGPATFFEGGAIFRVRTATGRWTDITVRPTDRVEVTRYAHVFED